MTALRERLQEYLDLRHALGFKLERETRLLPQVVAHVEQAGGAFISTALALGPKNATSNRSSATPARLTVPRTLS